MYSKRKPRPTWLYCILCILLFSSVKNTVNTFVIFFFYTDICSCLCLQYIYSTNKVIKNKSKCIFLISGVWSQQFLSHSIGVKWQMDCLSKCSSSQLHSHTFAAAVISTTLGCESVANVSCRGSWISNLTCISQPFSTKWRGLVLTLSLRNMAAARKKGISEWCNDVWV